MSPIPIELAVTATPMFVARGAWNRHQKEPIRGRVAGSDLVNVLVLIGDDRVTGPVKDVLQLLEALRGRHCRYVLVTCLPEGADATPVEKKPDGAASIFGS